MKKHILGVQANLWTEYITSPAKVEYAMFPRFFALSEIAWVPDAKKDYLNFMTRVSAHFARLDNKNIQYRIPEPEGLSENKIKKEGDKATITLTAAVPGAQIFYTLDGHMPDETTHVYTKPLVIPVNRNIKVRAITLAPNKRKSAPVEFVID
jgi:hexosaminidase